MRAFRVVPFTVAFNQEYCFEVAVAELKRQVAGLVSQMKAQGVPSGVPTPKSAGLPPGGGGPWEEPLPRERAKKKKPIQPADVEQQPGVAGLPQADAAARAAAKQEANRAALALRSRSPVMIPRKSVATPKQVPEQKHRTREDEKAAKHKATWLDNIPSDSGRGRGGGPPGIHQEMEGDGKVVDAVPLLVTLQEMAMMMTAEMIEGARSELRWWFLLRRRRRRTNGRRRKVAQTDVASEAGPRRGRRRRTSTRTRRRETRRGREGRRGVQGHLQGALQVRQVPWKGYMGKRPRSLTRWPKKPANILAGCCK